MHTQVAFELTPGLKQEIDHLEKEEAQIYESIQDLINRNRLNHYNATISELHSRLPSKSTILDVGCGFGETSLLLAQHGHQVYSVEPSNHRLAALQHSAQNMQLPIQTYLCSAESLNQAPLPKMDGCLFNSSLHHCDDPLMALKGAQKVVKKGGLIVINEPSLKFYSTKSRFYKKLKADPIKMGDYGGNEHIYRFNEYYNLLKTAGFKEIQFFWSHRSIDPRITLIRELNSRFHGSYQYTFARCIAKYLIHKLLKYPLIKSIVVPPLLRLSLLQTTFIGER